MSIKRALIWRGAGHTPLAFVDSGLTAFLKAHDVQVDWVHCDAAQDGCNYRTVHNYPTVASWADACASCQATNNEWADKTGPGMINMSSFDTSAAIADPADRMHVEASAVRYLQASPKLESAEDQAILAGYERTAAMARSIAEQLAADPPDLFVLSHGIYVDWGPAFDVFLDSGARVVRWSTGFRHRAFFLRQETRESQHHMFYAQKGHWEQHADNALTDAQQAALDESMDAMEGHNKLKQAKARSVEIDGLLSQPDDVADALDLDRARPIWLIYPHLNWDAHHSFETQMFEHTEDWLLKSVLAACETPEVQWVIKAHPAEHQQGTKQGSEFLIRRAVPELPSNVQILSADSVVNTYGLLPLASGVLTQRGTVGLEAAMRGIPSLLGGEAHYGGKGFTVEPQTEPEYLDAVRSAATVPRLSSDQIAVANRYAYDFWVRRQVLAPPGGMHALAEEKHRDHPAGAELRRILLGV